MFKIKAFLIIVLLLLASCAPMQDNQELKKEKYKDVISEKEKFVKKAPEADEYTKEERDKIIKQLLQWADEKNIIIVGVDKTFAEIYETGLDRSDYIDPRDIPKTVKIAEGLYKLPEDVIRVMSRKTIYISTKPGNGHVLFGTGPYLDRGFILEQPVTAYDVLHEFAHVLDNHGIKGMAGDPQNHWQHLVNERNTIFKITVKHAPEIITPPEGYISVYSMSNQDENFAEHFTAYIVNPDQFRERAENEPLLKQKYDFFKNNIFNSREY